MHSIWTTQGSEHSSEHPTPRYPPLTGTIETDTVVVGAGMTGLTTALRLRTAGQRVVVLEADRVGAGSTGGSTGNLYATLSSGLADVRDKWDDEVICAVVRMRMRALEQIERNVAELAIDCGFARRPLVCGVAGDDRQQLETLEREFEAAHVAGLVPVWNEAPAKLSIPLQRALRIEQQAQFDPWRYTRALAAALVERGVQVHEASAVTSVDAGKGEVETADGLVRAQRIVFATHTPIGFNLVQAEMKVYREYGVSAGLGAAQAPEGIFWVRDQSRSIRGYRDSDGHASLVVVGEKHKTGEGQAEVDYPERLRVTARAHFDTGPFEHQWSAQQYVSADGLPYIGVSAHDNVYIATGFAADGLIWGAVAAQVIDDLIAERESSASELLTPRRFTATKSARQWATESAAMVRHLVGDRMADSDVDRLDGIAAGEGRIVDLDGRKFAAYRSATGELSVLSPICPHLKCHVAWNPIATSWDCPCHGSRFDTCGRVLEGPSLHPLERFKTE